MPFFDIIFGIREFSFLICRFWTARYLARVVNSQQVLHPNNYASLHTLSCNYGTLPPQKIRVDTSAHPQQNNQTLEHNSPKYPWTRSYGIRPPTLINTILFASLFEYVYAIRIQSPKAGVLTWNTAAGGYGDTNNNEWRTTHQGHTHAHNRTKNSDARTETVLRAHTRRGDASRRTSGNVHTIKKQKHSISMMRGPDTSANN